MVIAKSVFTTDNDSHGAGRQAAETILSSLGMEPTVAVTYLTVNHDQGAFLRGLREVFGPRTAIVGASSQGILGRGHLLEEGYVSNVMGLGGLGFRASAAWVEDIHVDTRAKGEELGRTLRQGLLGKPKVAVLNYDPLARADMQTFLDGLQAELGCPIVGGAAAHFSGQLQQTYQYFGDEIRSKAAVAFAIGGDCHAEMIISAGCAPIGIEVTVTRTDGTKILEIDGRPAVEVWQEITGTDSRSFDHSASIALGVQLPGAHGSGEYLMRKAFGVSEGGVVVQVAIPTGTRVMLHHRTVENCLEGMERMGAELKRRLAGRKVRAVFGFECGARTRPFLGQELSREANLKLQAQIGDDAEWIGMIAWGEIFPVAGRAGYHNYAYPLLALAD